MPRRSRSPRLSRNFSTSVETPNTQQHLPELLLRLLHCPSCSSFEGHAATTQPQTKRPPQSSKRLKAAGYKVSEKSGCRSKGALGRPFFLRAGADIVIRSEEHTSELQ